MRCASAPVQKLLDAPSSSTKCQRYTLPDRYDIRIMSVLEAIGDI